MRTVAILFISLLILMTVPVHISADDPLPTNDLVVDERWVDIIQAEDRETLDVVEFIFLNNTGTDTFNGTIYSWLPDEAIVRSKCCGNAPNMACRMDEGGVMLCFDMLPTGIGNIVHGQPFEPDTFMSYFGQDATIVIEGVAQNSSYSDSLFLNVTVGQPQTFGDFPVVTGDGLHLTDNAEQLGVVATIPIDASGMAERLGLIQSINITNISPFNDTVDFEITGLMRARRSFSTFRSPPTRSRYSSLMPFLLKVPTIHPQTTCSRRTSSTPTTSSRYSRSFSRTIR
jgi:hypothetical protein